MSSGYAVIGAGLPRTGTHALKIALEQILQGPTYHMISVWESKGGEDVDFWRRTAEKKTTADDWRRFVRERDLRAGVDYPISFYWREQLRLFPKAKVILTVRSADSWYRSVRETIYQVHGSRQLSPYSRSLQWSGGWKKFQMMKDLSWAVPDGFDTSVCGPVEEGQKKVEEFFAKWVDEVRSAVPRDRLLIYEVKDGWKPLCEFLGLPIPDTSFPMVNNSKEFGQVVAAGLRRMAHESLFRGLAAFVAVAAAAAVAYCYFIY